MKTTLILYRANPALSARVASANADWVKEFPAEMSIEDIVQQLPALDAETKGLRKGEDYQILVDGTVMSAMQLAWSQAGAAKQPFHTPYPRQTKVIRQDNQGAYDWYAGHIAEAAKKATRLILVRHRIAHHNSEPCGLAAKEMEERRDDPTRIDEVVARWVERFAKHGLVPEVVPHFRVGYGFVSDGTLVVDPSLGSLEGAVVVCDHHNGCELEVPKRGGIWFNAFPRAEEFTFE